MTNYNNDSKNKEASPSDKSGAPKEQRTDGKVQEKQVDGAREESASKKEAAPQSADAKKV